MDERIFARFHLGAEIGEVVMQAVETSACRDWLGFAGIAGVNRLTFPNQLQVSDAVLEQLNSEFPTAGFDGHLRFQAGTEKPRNV
jgi:hypothetical protein